MSALTKPLALVFGATGRLGKLIADGLLRSGAFTVAIATRSDSNLKVDAFRQQGTEVRVVDVTTASQEALQTALHGADFVVSTLAADVLQAQRPLFAAAKAAGVKRVIPSDFAPHTTPGEHLLNDKNAIKDYIRTLGVPYTFVETGWWLQLALPYPPGVLDGNPYAQPFNNVYGEGNKKNALTDMHHMGDIVACVLLDERAVDYTVFYRERVSGLGETLLARQVRIHAEAFDKQVAHIRAEYDKLSESEKTFNNVRQRLFAEYTPCMYLRGDNTVENAKQAGKLDGRAFYPDLKGTDFEEYATAFYKNPPPLPF